MSELLSTSRIYYLVAVVKREAGNPEKSAPVTVYIWMDALFGYNTKSIHANVHSSRLSMWKSFSAVRLPLWKVATGWDLPFSSCSSIQSPNPSWSGGVFKYFLPSTRYFSVHTWSDDQRLEVPLEYEGVVPCPGVDDQVAGGVGEQPGLPRPPEVVSQVRGLGQERAECLLNTIRRSGDLLIMRG